MKKILDFCERYSTQLLILFLILCAPKLRKFGGVNSYHTYFYFTDYSTGFGGKKFLGEICSLWFPEVVNQYYMLPLIIGVNIIMVALFIWFCTKCLSRLSSNSKTPFLILIVIYMLSPYSFVGLIDSACVDFYLCAATLGFLYLFIKHRGTWYYYMLTLVLVCVACLTHHIFCNIYFPLFFALFIYDIYTNDEHRKKNIILYSTITICLFVLFCAIAFCGTMNVDFETYYNYLQTRASGSVDLSWKSALYYEFYAHLPEHVVAYVEPIWKYNIARFVLTLIVLAPLWVIFLAPWVMAVCHAQNTKEKWCYVLMQVFIHLIILPAYIMAVDYQRWTYAYCFVQFCLLFLMYYLNDHTLKVQIDKMINTANKYKVITVLVIISICSWGLVNNASALPIINKFCDRILGVYWTVNEVLPEATQLVNQL